MVDATRILGHLWQGGAPDLEEVQKAGFDTVVLAAIEHQPPKPKHGGLRVIRCPIDDDFDRVLSLADRQSVLNAAHQAAQRALKGHHVLVTCYAGLNRSGLVTALAIHMITGWPADTIIGVVRAKRGPRSLSNPDFVAIIQHAAVARPLSVQLVPNRHVFRPHHSHT